MFQLIISNRPHLHQRVAPDRCRCVRCGIAFESCSVHARAARAHQRRQVCLGSRVHLIGSRGIARYSWVRFEYEAVKVAYHAGSESDLALGWWAVAASVYHSVRQSMLESPVE